MDVTEQEIFGRSSDSDCYDVNGDSDIHGDDQKKIQDHFLRAAAPLSEATKGVFIEQLTESSALF